MLCLKLTPLKHTHSFSTLWLGFEGGYIAGAALQGGPTPLTFKRAWLAKGQGFILLDSDVPTVRS